MTVDLDDRNAAWSAVLDPSTDPTTLAAIAARYEEFGPRISSHVNSYAGLREWIAARAVEVSPVPVAVIDRHSAQPVASSNVASTAASASRARLVRSLWIVTLVVFSVGGVLEWIAILSAPPFWWDDVARGVLTFVTLGLLKTALLAVTAGLAAPTLGRKIGGIAIAFAFGAVSIAGEYVFGDIAWVYGTGVADLMVAGGIELALGFALAFLAFAVAYPVRGLAYLGLAGGLLLILLGFLASLAVGGLALIAVEVVTPGVAVAISLTSHRAARSRSTGPGIRPIVPPASSAASPGPDLDPAAAQRTNILAILALVFGVIGGSVLAIVFGHVALNQIRRTGENGRGLALAGLVLGYIGIAFLLLGFLVAIALLLPAYL